jgi:hypothetical protein
VLSACGGGSFSSDIPASTLVTSVSESVQMKVIDGAIKSASVCRDKNANSAYDQVEFKQADATGHH